MEARGPTGRLVAELRPQLRTGCTDGSRQRWVLGLSLGQWAVQVSLPSSPSSQMRPGGDLLAFLSCHSPQHKRGLKGGIAKAKSTLFRK